MTNHEHVVKILTRDVSQLEKHQTRLTPEEIKTREALLWLADRVDELEAFKFHHKRLHDVY